MLSKLICNKIDNWLNIAQSSFYPYTCFICHQPGINHLDLCGSCANDLITIEQTCTVCDIQLNVGSAICGRCLKTTPYFDQITTLYRYEGIAKLLIQSLKFQSKHSCARIMGELLMQHVKKKANKPDVLMAVPLHSKRLSERGFNQSELIAEHIHKGTDIPLIHHQLKRTINTQSQTSLKAAERRKNLKDAFQYSGVDTVKSVAIIDDVVTTGSTANEIAKTLKQQGVERVEIWAFARA